MGFLQDIFKDIKGDVSNILRDIGLEPKSPPDPRPLGEQAAEVVKELRGLTTDETEEEVVLRALVVYRAVVQHAARGGTVKFVDSERTLKVRLR